MFLFLLRVCTVTASNLQFYNLTVDNDTKIHNALLRKVFDVDVESEGNLYRKINKDNKLYITAYV